MYTIFIGLRFEADLVLSSGLLSAMSQTKAIRKLLGKNGENIGNLEVVIKGKRICKQNEIDGDFLTIHLDEMESHIKQNQLTISIKTTESRSRLILKQQYNIPRQYT